MITDSPLSQSASRRESCTLPFVLAPTSNGGPKPYWNGSHFCVGNESTSVLEYGTCANGWTDELTFFHEETAGSGHFIDNLSRRYALGQIQRFLRQERPVVLEIGCSSGFMLKLLREQNSGGTTIGADVVRQPLDRLSQQLTGVPLFRFDLLECPLPDNSIDCVVALNVLEHIEDDRRAVAQLLRILKPGGIAVLEVPAGPELYDNYDRMLMHFRRYSMNGLRQILVDSGFRIEHSSHLGCFIYPGFWISKQLSKLSSRNHQAVNKAAVERNIRQTSKNRILEVISEAELVLGQMFSYPFGIRCLVTCSKEGVIA